jgi:hypothetical protein
VRVGSDYLDLPRAEVSAVSRLPDEFESAWTARVRATHESSLLQLLETPMFKRVWRDTDENIDEFTYRRRLDEAQITEALLDRLEARVREAGQEDPIPSGELFAMAISAKPTRVLLEALGILRNESESDVLSALLDAESIPYLAALRHTDEGLAKRARWEHTWDLQRREDLGESVGEIPVPPKYDREDYRDPRYWSLRGKLDVPRERFIAYPGAETDPKAPLFGWAGWDHLQRAKALASVYQQRKTLDGWDAPRLLPLLAGLRELLFWITLWHDAPDPDLDGARAGQVWAEFLEGERAYVGCSEDDLRAWRPAAKVRKGRAKG